MINVINTVGIGDGSEGVDQLQLVLSKGPGAGDIAVDSTTFQYVTGSERVVLTGSEFDTAPSGSDGNTVLTGSDRVTVTFALGTDTSSVLSEGDQATISIITPSGAKTTVAVTIPTTLDGVGDGEAIVL